MDVVMIKPPTDRKTDVVMKALRKVMKGKEEACALEHKPSSDNVVYVAIYGGLSTPLGKDIIGEVEKAQVRYRVV